MCEHELVVPVKCLTNVNSLLGAFRRNKVAKDEGRLMHQNECGVNF